MDDVLGNIGLRIRTLRKAKGLTIKDIADQIDITRSLISQIENNKVTPSLKTLAQIAQVLEQPIASLFEAPENTESPIVRRSERQTLRTNEGVRYQLMTRGIANHRFEVLENYYAPEGSTGFLNKHLGEECGIVLKGRFKVEYDDREYILDEGDSIYLDSTRPHKVTNIAEGESVAIWINCPPSW